VSQSHQFRPEDRKAVHERLQQDYPYYAKRCLRIKAKSGAILAFVLNTAQEYLHQKIEWQRKTTGRVRAIVVKGRQQGCSTYISGRYYHRATRNRGMSVFILSHEAETTKKLFKIVERFHDLAPDVAKPFAEIYNKRELVFEKLGSDYSVGTAGNENVGRGGTLQLFHGSEVAFWANTDQIQTGILQSVPDMRDTEIILESTANGMANMFYDLTMEAMNGKNDYVVVFIPWYWQEEYTRAAPPDGVVELSKEEEEYRLLYSRSSDRKIPLTAGQMYWRRAKINEFKSEWKFKQEYPAFLQEAFQTSGDTLISAQAIMRARKSSVKDSEAPLVIGVDPGRTKDRTVFVYRRGRQVTKIESFKFEAKDNVQMVIAGMLADRIEQHSPEMVNVDVGEGYGVIDRLRELGFGSVVHGVHFGEKPLDENTYLNKRAEMWCLMRDWFHGEEGEVSVPDTDELQRDLMCMPHEKTTSTQKIQLASKQEIFKLLKMSPDVGDGLALTFAYPVRRRDSAGNGFKKIKAKSGGRSPLLTLQKIRRQDKLLGRRR